MRPDRRQQHNQLILFILGDYLERNPDIRFGQALWNLGIIRREREEEINPPVGISWPLALGIVDPFYEEPWDTLKRMKGDAEEQDTDPDTEGTGADQ